MPDALRVVVVHDYLTQLGGAERVALALLKAFPGSRMVTSCYEPAATYPGFADHDITTLWPNRVGWLRSDPRRALPFLAQAFSSYDVKGADVIVCSSSGWAHGIGGAAPRVVYCHNPPRWLHQPEDYLRDSSALLRKGFTRLSGPLHRWDARMAAGAQTYVANSTIVSERIGAAYDIEAAVIAPPRGLEPEGPMDPVAGIEPGFLLTVGRPRSYKNTDVVCEAVTGLHDERLVVVGGLPAGEWSSRITGLVGVSDEQLRWLYANCVGVVAVAREDFGLTPVEAQAFGKPSVVLRDGGYRDSTVEGVTGVFVDAPHRELVRDGIRELRATSWDRERIRELGERFAPAAFAVRMTEIAARAAFGEPVPESSVAPTLPDISPIS